MSGKKQGRNNPSVWVPSVIVVLSLAAFLLIDHVGVRVPPVVMGLWFAAVLVCVLSLLLKAVNRIRAKEETDEREANELFRKEK